jgi:hypothetical protein
VFDGHHRGGLDAPSRPARLKGEPGLPESAAAAVLGRTLSTLHVAIQGVGAVGFHVAKLLTEHGARVTVADTDAARAQRAARALQALERSLSFERRLLVAEFLVRGRDTRHRDRRDDGRILRPGRGDEPAVDS